MLNNGYQTIPTIKQLMALESKDIQPDDVHLSKGTGSCIANRNRYKTEVVAGFTYCNFNNTDHIVGLPFR